MKQKNKTTHKHNYKVIEQGHFTCELGIHWAWKKVMCLCGDGSLKLAMDYGFIPVLPPDLFSDKPLPGVNYKIQNP